jgi:hypothetical protein
MVGREQVSTQGMLAGFKSPLRRWREGKRRKETEEGKEWKE